MLEKEEADPKSSKVLVIVLAWLVEPLMPFDQVVRSHGCPSGLSAICHVKSLLQVKLTRCCSRLLLQSCFFGTKRESSSRFDETLRLALVVGIFVGTGRGLESQSEKAAVHERPDQSRMWSAIVEVGVP